MHFRAEFYIEILKPWCCDKKSGSHKRSLIKYFIVLFLRFRQRNCKFRALFWLAFNGDATACQGQDAVDDIKSDAVAGAGMGGVSLIELFENSRFYLLGHAVSTVLNFKNRAVLSGLERAGNFAANGGKFDGV